MLGFDRKAARYVWTAALVVLLIALVYLVRQTLFVFVLAILFAYLLSPLVNLLDRFLPTRTRTPALALSYVIFVGLVVLFGTQIATRVAQQARQLAKDLPAQMEKWEQPSPDLSPATNKFRRDLLDRIRKQITEGPNDLLANVAQAGMKVVTLATDLIYVVIVPILAFFFLKDGRMMREHVLELVDDGPPRALLDDLMADINVLLAHYMRALVLLSLAAFAAFSIAFSIMGVPYSVLLAAMGGLLEFIPMLGPLTAGILIVALSALSGAPVVGVVIFLLAFRVCQDYILSPHLMGQGVQLHPLLVLFGVFAGAEIAGIAGAFLSVPTLALVRIFYLRIRKAHVSGQMRPAEPVRP